MSSREAELEELRAREEAKRTQEMAEGKLANKELEKFRERVSYFLSLLPHFSLTPL